MAELLVIGAVIYFIWYHTEQRRSAKQQQAMDEQIKEWNRQQAQAKRRAKWEEMNRRP
ncbi:hypothetical protein D3C75_333230 [compost metagenome]